jgi:hypothetical protein
VLIIRSGLVALRIPIAVGLFGNANKNVDRRPADPGIEALLNVERLTGEVREPFPLLSLSNNNEGLALGVTCRRGSPAGLHDSVDALAVYGFGAEVPHHSALVKYIVEFHGSILPVTIGTVEWLDTFMDSSEIRHKAATIAIVELWSRRPETQGSITTVRRFDELARVVEAELSGRVSSPTHLSLATFERLFEEAGLWDVNTLLAVHGVYEASLAELSRDTPQ